MMPLHEILQQVKQLNSHEQRMLAQQILEMSEDADASPINHHLTVYDLIAMPADEREWVVARAFANASGDVFETFETDDEIDFNDDASF